jgi:hypothetical protein
MRLGFMLDSSPARPGRRYRCFDMVVHAFRAFKKNRLPVQQHRGERPQPLGEPAELDDRRAFLAVLQVLHLHPAAHAVEAVHLQLVAPARRPRGHLQFGQPHQRLLHAEGVDLPAILPRLEAPRAVLVVVRHGGDVGHGKQADAPLAHLEARLRQPEDRAV